MKLGQKAMEALRAEVTGLLQEGDELVVAGAAALKGTSLIVDHEREVLGRYFSEGFLWDALRGSQLYGVSRLEEKALVQGAHAFYWLGTGGILAGLWKMAEASEIGLHADLRKIPIRQETIEICERFDLNPYKLFSEGNVLIGTADSHRILEYCCHQGIPAAVIGRAVKGSGRLLYSGENTRYLERPSQDELTKFAWGEGWRSQMRIPGGKEDTTNAEHCTL